jgi:hypothetical protein
MKDFTKKLTFMKIQKQALFLDAFSPIIERYNVGDELDLGIFPKAAVWSMLYYCMPSVVRALLLPLVR